MADVIVYECGGLMLWLMRKKFVGSYLPFRRISECNYGWTAAYEQRGPNITVQIQLNKDANVTDAELAAARARWEPGIRNKWSRRFACCDDRTATTAARCSEACTLMFSVEWVTSNAHHVVWIQNTAALPSAKRE